LRLWPDLFSIEDLKKEEPVTSGGNKKATFAVAVYECVVAGPGFEPGTFGL